MTQSPVPTTAVAAADATSTKPIFGVILILNGKEVPLSGLIEDIETKGFKFNLPQPVDIGSPDDLLAWIDATFKTSLKTTLDPNKLPDPLKNFVSKLLKLEITVIRASINVPPKSSSDNTTYTIEISATFPDSGIQLIPGSDVLLLKGVVAGATNDPAFTG